MPALLAVVALGMTMTSCTADTGSPGATPALSSAPAASPATRTAGAEPPPPSSLGPLTFEVETFAVPSGSRPHDVAPAADGGVWYTAQASGELGWLDPRDGTVREIPLGSGSAPHGVIVGPDGAPWITDSGLNAVLRVDPESGAVTSFPLPGSAPVVSLNTAAFDGDGTLWFTGQRGYYGSVDPASGQVRVFDAPRGTGPYGIAATPAGDVYFSSLAGSYLGAVDRGTGEVTVIEPPTAGAGLRRVWSDSAGRLWVAEWFAGQVGVYDPAGQTWREWPLPGSAQPYAVYVDETDAVWLTDFTANAIVRFDPEEEEFTSFPAEASPAEVRQLLGRPGEVWGAESAADRLVVVRYGR